MKLIPLTKSQVTKVDNDLYSILSEVKWCVNYRKVAKKYYVKRVIRIATNKPVTEYLHWYVIGKPLNGFVVDHINGDTLDNRRENLHITTIRKNNQNQLSHRNGRLVGASYYKRSNKWGSQIVYNYKTKYLGYFATELEAHLVYINELKKRTLA